MIEEFNYLLRMIALGSGLMLLAQIAANEVRTQIKVPLIGMIVGVIFYLINSTPLTGPAGPFDPWIDLLSLSTPFFIWLFARRLFEREPAPRIIIGAAAILLLGWFLGNFIPAANLVGFFILHLGSLILIIDLVRIGVLERSDDLVEQRRAIRLWLPLLVAAQAASILIFEMAEMVTFVDSRSPVAQLINSLIIVLLMLFAGLALMRTDPELLLTTQTGNPADEPEPALDLSPSETVLHEKLIAAMAAGTYREPGLTIAGLADHLETPEHRLRALINRRMGHRNFSAFLNQHRIAEAREKLANREEVDLPVLTIAMDLGYSSLPTFNRAFRSETGTTPTDFRRLAINDSAPSGEETTGQN